MKQITVGKAAIEVELIPSLVILAERKRPSPKARKPELERFREALLEKLWPLVYKMRGPAFFKGTIIGT